MKPLSGLLRSLGFGLVAALGSLPFQLAFSGLLGPDTTLAAYALACACGYSLAIAPSLRAAFGAAVLVFPLSLVVAVLAPSAGTAVVGAALIVALARGLMYRAQPARTLLLEVGLLVGSLVAARLFGGLSPIGLALGVWTYFLCQSAFFLLLRPESREREAAADPFDQAHARALALLERRP